MESRKSSWAIHLRYISCSDDEWTASAGTVLCSKEEIICRKEMVFYLISNISCPCELKVCSTKKPWNPTAPPALPAVPELSALCVIRAPALKGGKNVSENNA